MVTFRKEYSNGEITVHWKPEVCIHSGVCARNLSAVFDPWRKPWIALEHATSDAIVHTVERCPSGALRWTKNEGEEQE